MRLRRLILPVLAATVLALAGCAGATAAPASTDGARLKVVTSTNVYGDLARIVGGDEVDVTSIISSASVDPHEYEAGAGDQLIVGDAALIVENGAGYDAYMEALREASGSTAPVVVAVESSHSWPGDGAHDDATPDATSATGSEDTHPHSHDHAEGAFNEHVWYDPHTVSHVVEAIRDRLIALRPAASDLFTANAATLATEIEGLETRLDGLKAAHDGAAVLATEPVAQYLLTAVGAVDVTPAGLAEAVEGGRDVAPSVLLEALAAIDSGAVKVLVANSQTGGAETTQLIAAAEAKGIPVLEFTETLPDGQTYLQWMTQNISQLAGALDA